MAHTTKSAGKGKDYTYEIKDLPDSQKQIVVKVTPAKFQHVLDHVFEELAPTVNVSGFRPGKAPRNLVEAKLGARLFEESVNHALPEVTSAIMAEIDLTPLDYAQYAIQKVSKDDGLEYTTTFTVMPEVKLPDFKKLKTKKKEAKVDKKEVEESIKRLKESILKPAESDKEDKDAKKAKPKTEKDIDWGKELNDDSLKTEADVRKRIEEVMQERKNAEAEEAFIDEIMREAVKAAKITAPKSLIEAEIAQMERQYRSRIEQLGLKVEDFLKTQKTDIETLRKNWASDAEFKIAADLLFVAIAKANDLTVEAKEVDAEIARVSDEKVRKEYESAQGRSYISSVLIRQKSLAKLKELAGIK